MINSLVVEEHLKKRGFDLSSGDIRYYARGWRHAAVPDPLYVKANRKNGKPVAVGKYPLVLHPDAGLPLAKLALVNGVHMAVDPYHSTNLARFPVRDNGGKKEITYGRAFQFAHVEALDMFIDTFLSHFGAR
jgi:hypothetical protein